MRLILLLHPLDLQQTMLSRLYAVPLLRAAASSPASQAAQSSLPAEAKPPPAATSISQAGDATIKGPNSPAAVCSPVSAPILVHATLTKSKEGCHDMGALPEQPGFLESCLSKAVATMGMSHDVLWPTPSSATWRQIGTVAVRAMCALKHVSQVGSVSEEGEHSLVQDVLMTPCCMSC